MRKLVLKDFILKALNFCSLLINPIEIVNFILSYPQEKIAMV